jgi:antitoxin FitA
MRQFDDIPLWNHNGSILQERTMPTTLTLKNIPDEVYKRLKLSADAHRRSLNSQVIVYLESALLPSRVTPSERLARARALRSTFPKVNLKARDIDAMKREGRK